MDTCLCPNGIDLDEMPRTINPDCPTHNRAKVVLLGKSKGTTTMTEALEKRYSRLETLELVASCAKDVVDYWPNMSFKTIRIMIPKMQALKEALEMLK
jgi:hypothetical protein